ncbi:MAG: type II toxin-antitoxin system RatA family toxin [Betaproteobacteria bacterium]|nr:type II toxin-antitoxin system RatA family toxin [Betaproteobacteria bacterium]
MPEVSKTVIVPYTPAQMFDLVDDVEAYPSFLPWCTGSTLLARDESMTRAMLNVGFRGVKQHFSTENRKSGHSEITMKLIEGPFRALDGHWRFSNLNGKGCKIEFKLAYEFSSRILATLVGPVFSHIADTMVDAFVKRADRLYGAG